MNLTLFSSPLAMLNGGELIALACVIGGLGFVLICAALSMYFRHRQSVLWHETARIALEKGQPVPALPGGLAEHGFRNTGAASDLAPDQRAAQQRAQRIRGYLIGGLMNIAIGTSTFIAFTQMHHVPENLRYFAAIPAFIGIALLLGGAIEALVGRKLDQTGKQR